DRWGKGCFSFRHARGLHTLGASSRCRSSSCRRRTTRSEERGMVLHGWEIDPEEGLPDDFLRFGIEFPDGARVTNIGGPSLGMSPDATEPLHGLESHSGGGSDVRYEQEFSAWPIPDEGALAFVCEWPAY